MVFLHHPRLNYGARDYIDLGFGIGIDELLGGKDEHAYDHAHKEQLHLDFLFLTINIDLDIQQHWRSILATILLHFMFNTH